MSVCSVGSKDTVAFGRRQKAALQAFGQPYSAAAVLTTVRSHRLIAHSRCGSCGVSRQPEFSGAFEPSSVAALSIFAKVLHS